MAKYYGFSFFPNEKPYGYTTDAAFAQSEKERIEEKGEPITVTEYDEINDDEITQQTGNYWGKDWNKITGGNTGAIPLHETLSVLSDWVDYEARVVDQAARDITEPDVSDAALEQAVKMVEAAEALNDAAEAARETTAEVFNETNVAQQDQATGEAGEVVAEVVAGNPGKFDESWVEELYAKTPDNETGSSDENGWYGLYRPYSGAKGAILSENSQGFVEVVVHTHNQTLLDKVWEELEAGTNAEYGNPDELPVEALPVDTVVESRADIPPKSSHPYFRELKIGKYTIGGR